MPRVVFDVLWTSVWYIGTTMQALRQTVLSSSLERAANQAFFELKISSMSPVSCDTISTSNAFEIQPHHYDSAIVQVSEWPAAPGLSEIGR